MQTKKLIEAFRGIGLRTKMGFDGDEFNPAYLLNVYSNNLLVVEIMDYGDSVQFLFDGNIELLDGGVTAEIVNILYGLVVKEDEDEL